MGRHQGSKIMVVMPVGLLLLVALVGLALYLDRGECHQNKVNGIRSSDK